MRFIQLRSAPAQNAWPLPASTTTRTDASFVQRRRNACVSSAISASSNALRSSGRLSVTRATAVALVSIFQHRYIRNTPNCVSSIGALSDAESARPSRRRVSAGSITPSSQSRALA